MFRKVHTSFLFALIWAISWIFLTFFCWFPESIGLAMESRWLSKEGLLYPVLEKWVTWWCFQDALSSFLSKCLLGPHFLWPFVDYFHIPVSPASVPSHVCVAAGYKRWMLPCIPPFLTYLPWPSYSFFKFDSSEFYCANLSLALFDQSISKPHGLSGVLERARKHKGRDARCGNWPCSVVQSDVSGPRFPPRSYRLYDGGHSSHSQLSLNSLR